MIQERGLPLDLGLDSDKKRLLENFFSLSVLQGANYILPLITLPYLVRVLGPEKFGLIAFAQAFIQYFNILTDYGFNLSATREISIHRENKEKVSEIFSSVMIIKLGLLVLSFLIMTIIVFSFEKFKRDWLIYYLTFGMVVGQALFPVWFFQGMERMKYITFLNITAKLIFAISIFVFVHEVSDYIYVPLINSLGFFISGILAIWIVVKDFNIRIYVPRTSTLVEYLRDSSQFFLSRVSVSIYTSTNAFVLGLFTNNRMVGYYSIAEKLYIALQQIYHPLVNTLYPYVAHKKNVHLYKKVFKLVTFANVILVLVLFMLSDQIIKIIFGDGLEVSVNIFKILLLSTMIVVPSILLGYPFLAAMGFAGYANVSVILGSFLHLVGLVILSVLNMVNVYSVALMVIVTESFVLIIRLYGVIKNRLWRTS
ncbi:flippase [Desulfurobacterium crinifex]